MEATLKLLNEILLKELICLRKREVDWDKGHEDLLRENCKLKEIIAAYQLLMSIKGGFEGESPF
jgi:hypothetical protein